VVVTGGTGFVGSHVAVELAAAGADVVLVDNLANSSREVAGEVTDLGGRPIPLYEIDVRDTEALSAVFEEHGTDAVVHCAGLKAVAESVSQPVRYWDVNVGGAVSVLEAMASAGVGDIVFSSSATVYGEPERLPIAEDAALRPASPYGDTKLAVERLLEAATAAGACRAIALRYFNPVGAHPSGRIGELPNDIPNNLMPRLLDVATGAMEVLPVWGTDYPTADGTAVRDYLHVCDLAVGHVAALAAFDRLPEWSAVNLGTGHGHSVLEVITALNVELGRELPVRYADRRSGDVPATVADPSLANRLLGWRADRTLQVMVRDAWHHRARVVGITS
jgi:UDP-glucose 4-epimerase